jgi:hypothetical protein
MSFICVSNPIELTNPTIMTAQVPDRIRYKRQIHHLRGEPMEDWFNEEHPRPAFFSENLCSCCWRGYRAMWSIKRNQLHLLWIAPFDVPSGDQGGSLAELRRYYLTQLFPNAVASVFADWFSGELVLESGRELSEAESPYCYAWEQQTTLQIVRGCVALKKCT